MSLKNQGLFVLQILRNNIGIMILTLLISLYVYPIRVYRALEGVMIDPEFVPTTSDFFVGLSVVTPAFLYIMAAATALSVFSYLFKRSSSDFFHAQAITRSKLLFLNCVAGSFIFLIPFAIGYGVLILRCIPVASQIPIDNLIGVLLLSFIFNALRLILSFTVATLCMTLASGVISTFIVYYTLFFAPVLFVGSCALFLERFLLGYECLNLRFIQEFQFFDGNILPKEVFVASLFILVGIVVIYFFANLAYKKRDSENMTRFLSINWMRNMFYFITMFAAMTFTLSLVDHFIFVTSTIVTFVVFVLSILLLETSFNPTLIKKSVAKFAVFIVVTGLVIIVLWSGILGNKNLPPVSEVEGVSVENYYNDLNLPTSYEDNDIVCTDAKTIGIVQSMQNQIISEAVYPVGNEGNDVIITYHLENGDTKTYAYNYDDFPAESVMNEFVNTQENKENMFYFLEEDYVLDWCYYYNNDVFEEINVSQHEYDQLYEAFLEEDVIVGLAEAVKQDIMNDPDLSVQQFDYDENTGEADPPDDVIFAIEFGGHTEIGLDDIWFGSEETYFYSMFMIKDSYTNTLTYINQVVVDTLGYGLDDL